MEKWFIRNRKANFALIAQQFGISEVTARIAVNRGISSNEELKAYLHPSLNDLHDPRIMKHMEKAANLIKKKIVSKKSKIFFCYLNNSPAKSIFPKLLCYNIFMEKYIIKCLQL